MQVHLPESLRKFVYQGHKIIKVIGSRLRSQEQKSVKSHPVTPFVTDMAMSCYNCSDGKSISAIRSMTLPACSRYFRSADRPSNDRACLCVVLAFEWKAILFSILILSFSIFWN